MSAYVVRDRDLAWQADDEQWLPVLTTPGGPMRAVVENLERSRAERLASDLDPVAFAAQQLRHARNLSQLSALTHAALGDPQGRGGGLHLIVARRAELAEEAAVAAAAVAAPTPELVARLGGRPRHGPERRAWDAAVAVVAVYRARRSAGPGRPGYGNAARWAIGPRPAEQLSPWPGQRRQAEDLVRRWAAELEPSRAERFWAVIEHIPRQRATAGIHALLAAGMDPAGLYEALSERERDTAKAGAAILEYRVKHLLRAHGVDPAAYHLAEPLSAAGEWDRVSALLQTAEIRSLSRRNVADLGAERSDLLALVGGRGPVGQPLTAQLVAARAAADQSSARLADARAALAGEVDQRRPDRPRVDALKRTIAVLERRHAEQNLAVDLLTHRDGTGGQDGAEHRAALRERHDLLTAAIDLVVDDAMSAVTSHPASYLTALLGDRPADDVGRDDWDRRARAVEAWRHHRLGLSYGQAAAGPDAPPSEQALGPPRADPIEEMARRRILDRTQSTLDLGAAR